MGGVGRGTYPAGGVGVAEAAEDVDAVVEYVAVAPLVGDLDGGLDDKGEGEQLVLDGLFWGHDGRQRGTRIRARAAHTPPIVLDLMRVQQPCVHCNRKLGVRKASMVLHMGKRCGI